ncbi:hypothetical protein MKX03_035001 [Papaver bracteatum]|nr:hypothetical protein MKX03_035001 [Papaver bracteatum]
MMNEAFEIKGCGHSFCSECTVRYVASKIQENIISVGCPETNCQGVLEPEFCRSILPPEVYDRWGNALCESVILGGQKFYCPFKDCSALLLDEGEGGILQSECPHCNRLFCAQCKVPWHSGIICEDFQKLNVDEREGEDIMLMESAKKNKWHNASIMLKELLDACLLAAGLFYLSLSFLCSIKYSSHCFLVFVGVDMHFVTTLDLQ